jgi:feruloyl esterase
VLADFAGRSWVLSGNFNKTNRCSLHTITTIGKKLTNQFYKKPVKYSYFLGCSQGGRQGIGSAQKYPADFDGMVVGACALDFNHLASWRASFFPITGSVDAPGFIKKEVWTGLIHDEVLRQCDALDGLRDGILETPELCDFKPETLLCPDGKIGHCLSEKQVDIVRKVFSPMLDEDGRMIYPAMQPGSELRAVDRLYSGKPFTDSQVSISIGSKLATHKTRIGSAMSSTQTRTGLHPASPPRTR